LRFPLDAAAIALCVLLFRRRRSLGWLLLGMMFVQPFYQFVLRLIKGYPLLPDMTISGPTTVGAPANVNIRFDFPLFLVCAVAGLYLLYRKGKQDPEV